MLPLTLALLRILPPTLKLPFAVILLPAMKLLEVDMSPVALKNPPTPGPPEVIKILPPVSTLPVALILPPAVILFWAFTLPEAPTLPVALI